MREHPPLVSAHLGWAEQDPHDWWPAAVHAVREALAKAGLAGENVACVGLAGQIHGAVLLAANDEVLRPALIWCSADPARV
jgi:xylulokinase